MTFNQLKEFLGNFKLSPDSNATLTLDQYQTVITAAEKWYGGFFAQWLMDCFMPTSEPIEKGFEDSLSHYVWLPSCWQELETDFNQSEELKRL